MVKGEAERFIREKEREQFLHLPISNASVTSDETVIYFPTGVLKKGKAHAKLRNAEINFKYKNTTDKKIMQ